jgi:dihydrodipicolinate synthase/N-acetylneuraminate lyase
MIGLKDATSDMARAASFIAAAPTHFACYSGDDATALPYMLLGGHGTISVTANVLPATVAKMCAFALEGNVREARQLNTRLIPLYQALSLDTNPIPIKYAMSYLKLISNTLRLPLLALDEQRADQVVSTMKDAAEGLQELANLLEAAGSVR